MAFADGLLELDRRKNARSLSTNGTEGGRIDAQGLEDGRRHLGGAHCGANRLWLEARMRQQQNDICVVMREPAVLLQFRGTAGVSNAHVRGHDDVRRARVLCWVVVVKRY